MKTNTAYRFTDAEMETARETELPDLLESLGYHVQQIGAYHTTKEMDSLRIKNRRTWYRYSEGTGGDTQICQLPRHIRPERTGIQGGCGRQRQAHCLPPPQQARFRLGTGVRGADRPRRSEIHFPPFPPAAKTAVHSFAPPFPIGPASLGSNGSPTLRPAPVPHGPHHAGQQRVSGHAQPGVHGPG